jgi:hypothetical protein
MDDLWSDPSLLAPTVRSGAVSFENPSGARGAGGTEHGGRKGAPWRRIEPGERVVLAELDGPGTLRHWWMTFPLGPPEQMRSLYVEVFYDGAARPSMSVPCLDLFGLPLGRPVAYTSALSSCQEGRGFNLYVPMPFREHVRVEIVNGGATPVPQLYYQIDFTLGPVPDDAGYLHTTFRRENPTTMRRDFTIADGIEGPGRFLGCNVGVRVLDDGWWYGEGEVKVYLDGDTALPTICGTGLEDYVGTAWGMGPHHALYAGAPLEVKAPGSTTQPDLLAFYRWHLPDPVLFQRDLRVTIQQIGMAAFMAGEEEQFEEYATAHPAAGPGWYRMDGPVLAMGIAERVDDYCATAYVYAARAQPVPRLDLPAVVAEIERLPYEKPLPMEGMFGMLDGGSRT